MGVWIIEHIIIKYSQFSDLRTHFLTASKLARSGPTIDVIVHLF